jgi:hypothetical protein
MTQQLADQQQLRQELVDAYVSFANSMASFEREGVEATQKATDQAANRGI